jgi:hypothetical protein
VDVVAVTFAPVRFAAHPIHAAISFSANVKGCYVTPPEQEWAFARVCAVSSTYEPWNTLLCSAVTLWQNAQVWTLLKSIWHIGWQWMNKIFIFWHLLYKDFSVHTEK